MNKDFEKEYKELAEIEAPDLWDRIEAGIAEKEISESTAAETTKKKTVFFFAKRYSALAAALLCAVILIPVFGIIRYSGSKNMTAESAEDMDYTAAAGAADASEEYEVSTEESVEESVEESAEASSEEAAEDADGGSMDEACAEKAPVENAETRDTVSDSSASMADEGVSVAEQKKQKEEAEEQKLTGIVVKVTDAESHFEEDSSLDEIGTYYTAVVENDPSGTLEKGEQIEIFIPAYSSMGLVKEEVFELDLVSDEERDGLYTVAGGPGRIEE